MLGVGAHAAEQVRGDRALVGQADGVQAGFAVEDPFVVPELTGGVQGVQVQPVVVRGEPGAPHHRRGGQRSAVGEYWYAVPGIDDSRQPVHACGLQLTRSHPPQRVSAAAQSPLGQDSTGPAQPLQQRVGPRPEVRDVADVAPSQVHLPLGPGVGGQFQGDLGTGVARADDQHWAAGQLGRAAVVTRVQLSDAGVQLSGERRNDREVVSPGGQHHVAGPPAARSGHDQQVRAVSAHGLDPHAQLHGQFDLLGVAGQVVGDGVLAGVLVAPGREGQPRQVGEAGWGEQPQRVPAVSPAAPDSRGGVQDDEVFVALGEVVAGGQAGLAGTDDHCVHLGGVVVDRHALSFLVR